MSGRVTIVYDSYIVTGTSMIQGVNIENREKNVIVSAGAVVVRDIPDDVVTKGIPTGW